MSAVYQLLNYYGRWQSFKGGLSQLPAWARLLLTLAALPGVVLIALSILAFLVSLAALLLLTLPLHRLLSRVCGVRPGAGIGGFGPPPDGMDVIVSDEDGNETVVETPVEGELRPARRQIDVKIVE